MRLFRRRIPALAGLVAALLLAARPAPAVTPVFLLDSQSFTDNRLFRVDPSTGQLVFLGSLGGTYGEIAGLAALGPNELIATSSFGDVLRVTVSPFTVVRLGGVGGMLVGLATSLDGALYGLDESSDELVRITLAPLARVVIGLVRLGSPGGPVLDVAGGDLVQARNGTWYLWTNGGVGLYTIDVGTAVAQAVDPGGAPSPFTSGLAIDYEGGGVLYASSGAQDSVRALSLTTGQTVPGSTRTLCLTCPTPYDHLFGDLASPHCVDGDADGYSSQGGGCGPVDCDDADPLAFPGAAERCNGRDDDCDGPIDEEPQASASCATACTETAQCVAGSCVTTPRTCDDGNACTADSCDPAFGCRHVNQPDGLACSDGNVCTGQEVCQGGVCIDAPDLDCNDGNGCTQDSCAPTNGCRNTPVPGCCSSDADCADVSACTVNERCIAGSCISDPRDCDDTNPCTSDSCDPTSGCRNIAVVNGISCDDGNVCNGIATCQAGSCAPGTPPVCDDGSACTIDGCNPQSGCTRQPISGCCDSDADCADASACTINERCLAGACISDPLECDDGNPCTTDRCQAASGCSYTPVPNGQSCSDGNVCNGVETCQSGSCAAGTAPDCSDGTPCTTDTCVPALGCQHTAVPGCCFVDADCIDNSACTVDERCVSGTCVSAPRNCNDGNPCTADACDPQVGCLNPPLVDGSSCADGNACDGVEACTAGVCLAGIPPDCDDRNFCTLDGCDNATGCRHLPLPNCCNTDADCTDADQCTVDERCLANHSCTSSPRVCQDGNACTLDTCDPAAGCQFAPQTGPACDDGSLCTLPDACSAGICVGAPLDCSDGNFCNGNETCVPATGTCTASDGPPQCIPGGRMPAACLAEWYVQNPGNPTGSLGRTQECRQGDPSCDFDADVATCTFRLALCLRIPDPRLPLCVPGDVRSVVLRRPRAERNPAEAGALLAAVGGLPGATIATRPPAATFEPPIGNARCTTLVPIAVPRGRSVAVRTRATALSGARDSDSLRLRCR